MEHNAVVPLFLILGVLIAASRVGGTLARRIGQPRVLGELIFGVMLGPTFLNLLAWDVLHGVHLETTIKQLAELGVLILMFIVGLEIDQRELSQVGSVGLLAGTFGALIPVVMTFPIVLLANYEWEIALFAGVALAATSVSISAQVLLELGFLRTHEGNALIAAALVDDILAILLVSITIAITGSGEESQSIPEILLRMGGFILIAGGIAWFVLPRVLNWLADQPALAQSYGIPAFALVILLLYGWTADEWGGVAAITGAFLAGFGMSRINEHPKREIENAVSHLAFVFLVPIFFMDVGLSTDLSAFQLADAPLAMILLGAAVLSKLVGAGIGARLSRFTLQESLRLGVCMVSRGEVGLIVVTLGVTSGIFTVGEKLYSALFLVIVLTTVLTPPLVRQAFREKNTQGGTF